MSLSAALTDMAMSDEIFTYLREHLTQRLLLQQRRKKGSECAPFLINLVYQPGLACFVCSFPVLTLVC